MHLAVTVLACALAASEMPAEVPADVPLVREDRPRSAKLASPEVLSPVARAAETEPPQKLKIGGYAKVGFVFQEEDPVIDYIGHSNGFRMAAARLELTAHPIERAEAQISIEAAYDHATDPLGVAGDKVVALRDAFIAYEFFAPVVLTAGQFKAPYSAEALLPDSDLLFLDRSVGSRGVTPPEGFATGGLSLERQLGATLSSRRLALQTPIGSFGAAYAVGAFNGNGANKLMNDNGTLTPVARLTVDWDEKVAFGAAWYRNPRTLGPRPDLMQEQEVGTTFDVMVRLYGVRAMFATMRRTRELTGIETMAGPLPYDDESRAVVAQIGYHERFTGLEPAYRYAKLDPSEFSPFESVEHHTLALNWKPHEQPVRFYLSYTLRRETAERTLVNDGLDLGAQLTF